MKKMLLPFIAMFVSVFAVGQMETVAATSLNTKEACVKTSNVANVKCTQSGEATKLAERIEGVVKAVSGLVGAFAVGMIVYGGFKYITSQGDPRQAEGAKNIIWYSGVGLFIVLFAYFIFDLLIKAMV